MKGDIIVLVNLKGELRGVEKKISMQTQHEYFIFRFEEVGTGKPFNVVSKQQFTNVELNRGSEYNLFCDLDIGPKFTKFELTGLELCK